MKKLFFLVALLHYCCWSFLVAQPGTFTLEPLVCALSQPWEIEYGPDDYLWTTESIAYRVTRIDPQTGTTEVVLDASNLINWGADQYPKPQSGFSGLAIHPDFMQGKPWVYLGFSYQFLGCGQDLSNCQFKTNVRRYTFDFATRTLINPVILTDTIPGSSDHNGGRLAIAPVGGTDYLFYTVGDMGAGQFSNATRTNNAQNPESYEGKILRFNLEPDMDTDPSDAWIPNDNPFNAARQSAVWTLGHRNPQGLAVGGNGLLYAMEHGPYSDDELNIVEKGANYGHPLVSGFADGNYDGSKVGAGFVPYIFSEADNAASIGSSYRDPIASYYVAHKDTVHTIHTNVENYVEPYPNYYLSWPTIAPSGIAFYGSDSIPGWKNSILIACLKKAVVYRVPLDATGKIVGDTIGFLHQQGRFRDIAISKDGRSIYVACDSVGPTSGPTLGTSLVPINRGCILEYRYTPPDPCTTDSIAPSLVCPVDILVYEDSTLSQTVTWDEPLTSDNCGPVTLVSSYESGTNFPTGIYIVEYTATDGANNTATCTFEVNVHFAASQNEPKAKPIKIAPNPAQDFVQLDFGSTLKNAQISVFNTSGQKILLKSGFYGKNLKLNVSDLSEGLYFVHVLGDDGVVYDGRFIVQYRP